MREDDSKAYVLYGDSQEHIEDLEHLATTQGTDLWTVPSNIRPNDVAIFYLMRPFKFFFARGVIKTEPTLNHGVSGWEGFHMAEIGDVKLLPSPVPFAEVRTKFWDDWPWVRRPSRPAGKPAREVPENVRGRLERVLGICETPV
jgi:hypothetical protein